MFLKRATNRKSGTGERLAPLFLCLSVLLPRSLPLFRLACFPRVFVRLKAKQACRPFQRVTPWAYPIRCRETATNSGRKDRPRGSPADLPAGRPPVLSLIFEQKSVPSVLPWFNLCTVNNSFALSEAGRPPNAEMNMPVIRFSLKIRHFSPHFLPHFLRHFALKNSVF